VDNLGTTLHNPVAEASNTLSLFEPGAEIKRSRRRAKVPNTRSGDSWPRLGSVSLTDREQAARLKGIGGSDANILLSGDAARILELWRVKRGDKIVEDLSGVMPVMLGCWTEPFNRQWYEKLSGKVVRVREEPFVCTEFEWRRCTVDGLIEPDGAVFEAKHTNAFAKPEEVLERYMPQLQHNMAVTRRERAVLSVIFGNHKYEMFEIAADWLYQQELLEAEAAFWDCVVSGREPVAADMPAAPKPVGVREVCFEGHNAWAFAAVDWLDHRDGAKKYAAAAGLIKSLVEDDVGRAFGHGVEAKRSKSGAITIKEIVR
jgi:hypothetical protein